MTSSKPYLIRGIYEWIADNAMTPYIAVNTEVPHIKVPLQYAKEGQIILNISQTAALNLQIDNHYITFSARFSGALMNVVVPVNAVLAIYPKEEPNMGMPFLEEEFEDNTPPPGPPSPPPNKPQLKRVK